MSEVRLSRTKPAELTEFSCRNLSVEFISGSRRRPLRVLSGLDFDIQPGEFVSILGGSGVGKTTLLRVLGGLQSPTPDSDVRYRGTPIDRPPTGVITVFQDYSASLLPWRTVERNVALGIEGQTSRQERIERIRDTLTMVGLEQRARDYPWQLSGGMQQRVQIARALVTRPRVLLMDEPFGALDAMTKATLQDALLGIHERTRTTIVFITHDVDEAVYLSQRIIVLVGSPGHIGNEIEVDLPAERDQVATKEDPHYLRIRHEVFESIGRAGRTSPSSGRISMKN